MRQAREAIIEVAADFDDRILADFVEGRPIEASCLQTALRRGVLECRLFPVLLGSALRNKGAAAARCGGGVSALAAGGPAGAGPGGRGRSSGAVFELRP
ncbi:MAG: hypothetical protein R2864_07165 [Syntrophotaleaceae bacterium]